MERIRIGVLGAARIAPNALTKPARLVPEVTVAAVAARDPEKAEAFARRQGIRTVHRDYAELLADPDLDAVYIPLPNGLHAEWAVRALEAGKHVLCEKPMTANEAEAREVAEAAKRTGLVCMEAFHWRYHPLARRMREILDEEEIGAVRHISTTMCFPLPMMGDIRYNFALAGGSLMDAGCYAVNAVRYLAPAPDETAPDARIEVRSARATVLKRDPRVDRAMEAHFALPGGATATMRSSMLSRHVLGISAKVVGERGEMAVMNYVAPHFRHTFTVTVDGRKRREHLGQAARTPTYQYQLQAFADAVLRGVEPLTPAEDAVETMRLIDDVYRKAGLPVRGTA
ncbi:Gfo/Idh/MocA family protein [Yinghuangia seranimata]|uniref:Gfo/Idh/MocA family protein n=1 Tax=Yinghuangia seranimata TaxID=408067 RepID=UPI00248BC2AF|nr:Gfo/Idh/MocA family oxidoreductase [Yinghuangia seranimata]MDI2132170.1 Gfo/Idh/MocA family oxidoreductase [Yinghuangia seranimata]